MNNFRKNLKRNKKHLNPHERRADREQLLKNKQKGYGLYVYENRRNNTLTLPKLAADGITKNIPPGGTFQGDDYFMFLVPAELRVKQIIIPADEERKKELMENKLILDQPETVTTEGVVERVVVGDLPLNENDPQNDKTKEVLINESPLDGVKIILG